MDGYRRVTAALRRVWRGLRRRPRTSILAFAVFVSVTVPIVPFTPHCGWDPDHYRPIDAPMSPFYRHFIKSSMRALGVYYWEIGETILVPVPIWLDLTVLWGGDGDLLLNAEGNTANGMGLDPFVLQEDGRKLRVPASDVGRIVDGREYRIPDHVKALRNPKTGENDGWSCEYIYAVVTGKPAPPGYRNLRKRGE